VHHRRPPAGGLAQSKDIVWLLTRYRMNLHLNSTLRLQLQKPHTERASLQHQYVTFAHSKHVVLQYFYS
jgi:hypothetical protein